MKNKTIILIVFAILTIFLVKNKYDNVVIPKESIRIRIISNSNESKDILEKTKVKKKIEEEIYLLIKNVKNVNEVREIIIKNLDNLNNSIKDTTNIPYSIDFGNNYFPKKTYNGIIYDDGIYESLVITIGEGNGDNWWCVLFPPLCLLDENENTKDVEYKFLVKELIEKIYSK